MAPSRAVCTTRMGCRPSARHPRVRDNPLSTQSMRPQHHLPRTCYKLTPHPSIPPRATRSMAPATREVAPVPRPPHGAPESLSRGQWIDSHGKRREQSGRRRRPGAHGRGSGFPRLFYPDETVEPWFLGSQCTRLSPNCWLQCLLHGVWEGP